MPLVGAMRAAAGPRLGCMRSWLMRTPDALMWMRSCGAVHDHRVGCGDACESLALVTGPSICLNVCEKLAKVWRQGKCVCRCQTSSRDQNDNLHSRWHSDPKT
jgi:hypothetical protein